MQHQLSCRTGLYVMRLDAVGGSSVVTMLHSQVGFCCLALHCSAGRLDIEPGETAAGQGNDGGAHATVLYCWQEECYTLLMPDNQVCTLCY